MGNVSSVFTYGDEMNEVVCNWDEDWNDVWMTTCGQEFVFSDGGPLDNNFKVCPFCGKNIRETKYNRGKDEEDD